MFGHVKEFFFIVATFFGCNALKCVSMSNKEYKIRPEIISINSNEPTFYPYSVKVNKCSGSCNNINNPYSKIGVPDVVKNINVKVFNLMSRTNETRHRKWHETCKYKCRLNASVCNNKQCWNNDKCRCESKQLIDKGMCDKGFICNPSNCECKYDKSYDVREYLDYENFKFRKRFVDKLVEECSENIDENKLISVTLNDYKNVCESFTIYMILIVIFFIISISISCAFIYFYWYLKKDNTSITNINVNAETVIY